MIDIRHLIPSAYTGRFTINDISLVEYIAVHHTVSHITWNTRTVVTQMTEIQHLLDIDAMHRAWGLGGIGYHAAAFASGRAYKLSDYNLGRAHISKMNHRGIGVVLIGNFTNAVPLPSHLAATRDCIADIRQRYQEFLGANAPNLIVEAHRNIRLQNTTCPGNTWEEWGPKLEEEPMEIQDDFAGLRKTEIAWIQRVEVAHQVTQLRQMQTISAIRHSQHESPEAEMDCWTVLSLTYDAEIEAIREAQRRCRVHGRPG